MTSLDEQLEYVYNFPDRYQWVWFSTLPTFLGGFALFMTCWNMVQYLRVRFCGVQTKALLLNKLIRQSKGRRGRSTSYFFVVQYALHRNGQYTLTLYTRTMRVSSLFFKAKYVLNTPVEIKFVHSMCSKTCYQSVLLLRDEAQSMVELCCLSAQCMCVSPVCGVPLLYLGLMPVYGAMGYFGVILVFVHLVFLRLFYEYCCCRICNAKQYREERRQEREEKLGTVISEEEFTVFQQKLSGHGHMHAHCTAEPDIETATQSTTQTATVEVEMYMDRRAEGEGEPAVEVKQSEIKTDPGRVRTAFV